MIKSLRVIAASLECFPEKPSWCRNEHNQIQTVHKKSLNRITKQAAKVTQSELSSIDDLYCNIVTNKVECIMANSCHALHDYYEYENRYQAACPFMQNAAVQKIFCTELDTCDKYPVATCVNDVVSVYAACTYEIQSPS